MVSSFFKKRKKPTKMSFSLRLLCFCTHMDKFQHMCCCTNAMQDLVELKFWQVCNFMGEDLVYLIPSRSHYFFKGEVVWRKTAHNSHYVKSFLSLKGGQLSKLLATIVADQPNVCLSKPPKLQSICKTGRGGKFDFEISAKTFSVFIYLITWIPNL